MTLPMIISLCIGGVFILALVIFLLTQKKEERKEALERMKEIDKLDIEIKSATAEKVSTPEKQPPTDKRDMSPVASEPKPAPEPPKTQPTLTSKETAPPEQPSKFPESKKTAEAEPQEPALEFNEKDFQLQHGLSETLQTPETPEEEEVVEPDFGGLPDYGSIFEPQDESDDIFEEPSQSSDTYLKNELIIESEEQVADIFSETASAPPLPTPPAKPAGPKPGTPKDVIDQTGELQIPTISEPSPTDIFSDSSETAESKTEIPAGVPSESEIDTMLRGSRKEKKAAPPKPAKKISLEEMDPEERKRHEKARRIARVIINDVRNYNPEKLAEGIKAGNIMKTLGVEIERGRQLYIKRVPPDIARTTNYYRESLIKILADGRADLFGWK